MMTQEQLTEYWRGLAFYLIDLIAAQSDMPNAVRLQLFDDFDDACGILRKHGGGRACNLMHGLEKTAPNLEKAPGILPEPDGGAPGPHPAPSSHTKEET